MTSPPHPIMLNAALVEPLTTVVFLVGIGFLCRALRLVTDAGARQLADLVINVTLPTMLFMSGTKTDIGTLLRQGPLVAIAGMVFPLSGYAAGAAIARLLRLPRGQAAVVRICAAIGNTSYVGIPVCTALWGPEGALLAAIYDQVMIVPFLILAPLEYGRSSGSVTWRSMLLSPMLWGMILGIAWRSLALTVPALLATPLQLLGDVTFPLALILVGTLALPTHVDRSLAVPLAGYLVARLILAPLVALVAVLLLGLHGAAAGVTVLQTAMPASVLLTVMARRYNVDANLAAAGALLSFPVAAVTLPVITMLLVR